MALPKEMTLVKPWEVLEKNLLAAMREAERLALKQQDTKVRDRLARIRAEAERGLDG
jgi:hypothetical protein